ncbi:MAG: GNAT family N-acetyltransferase [Eubacterium sp.]
MFLKDNDLDLTTYLFLRKSVGWKPLTERQADLALKGSLLTVTAYDGKKPVGMGRLVGDGAVICYIQDLIVVPEYQGKGVGDLIIESLIDYVKEIRLPGTQLMLDLMCATGREAFYKRHGFIARPTDKLGPGMIRYIEE